jgi:uncharacterized YccA/Bax inhibitor family protein
VPQSNNPVLTKMTKTKDGYATFGEAPTATATTDATSPVVNSDGMTGGYTVPAGTAPAGVARITITDVIVKTGAMFAVLLVTATAAWQLDLPTGLYIVLVFAALGVGLWASVRREVSPGLYLLYAALEGVVVGWISKVYNDWAVQKGAQSGIVGWAILGTLVTFAVMLILYRAKFLRATPQFTKMMMIGLISYATLSLISFVAGAFLGVGDGLGFYGFGAIGILFCVIGVGLAAFTLVLDFAMIEQLVSMGAPERESWRAAFGLTVTLVWLYLELLRLLAILNSR